MFKKLSAEFLGTFWLVFGGCGSAVLAAAFPEVGIGLLGVSFAFGLTVAGKFPASSLVPYIVAQVVGAVAAAAVLYLIASGKAGFAAGGFASNGYGELSPGGYSLTAALVAEVALTAFFLIIILGSTHGRAPAGFAPIAIGLGLTLIHLVSIPVTNTSVNPARSTGVALFAETAALSQLWLFWVAPIVGAVIGGVIWKIVGEND
jgi:aquaporin Z